MRWPRLGALATPAALAVLWSACAPALTARATPDTWVAVVSHAWHTDIAVRLADVPAGSWPDAQRFPDAEIIEIGWGDRDYFTAPEETLALGARAIFRSRGSALRVVWLDGPIERRFPDSDVVEIPIARSALRRLIEFIRESYALTADGAPVDLGPGPWPRSRFYLATGHYGLFNSSNQWTARALRSAGLPFVPASSLTVGSVLCQAASIGRVARLRHDCGRSPAPHGSP
jgi:uncharacterized protein (TIGR02117 family)